MLKLGEKIINQIYLGDKKIAKVFLGDNLVYQSGQPILLDYIKFDGNSWIDTEIKPIFGDELEITAQIGEAVAGKNYVLFGTGTSSIQFTGLIESNRVFNRYFGTTAGRSTGQDSSKIFHTYLFKNDGSVYQNGKLITSPFTVTEATVNSNLTIGTRGYVNEGWLGNISNAKLLSADGAVKLDLKPCIVNGVAGFYDMVTGKIFTNAGTGTLKASGRFVTSILFDGASWIDTGVKYQTCTVKTETKFSLTGTRQLMGFSGASPIHYWGCNTSGYLDPLTSVSGLEFKEIEVAYNKDNADNKTLTLTADGKSAVKTGKMDTTNSYLIGCLNTSSYFAQCEVKYNEIYVNGELIQDLRPYVDENGKIYFKDLVTGDLFYNKGTGTLGYTE